MICWQKFSIFIYLLCFLFTQKKSKGRPPAPPPARSLDTDTTFLNAVVYKGIRLQEQSVLDIKHTSNLLKPFNTPIFALLRKDS